MIEIGSNPYGTFFSKVFSHDSVNFLDLVIFEESGRLFTHTFFKEVDQNGYIPLGSCHHPRWLSGIPKSQMLRVRKNCNKIEDYDIQSQTILDRFQEKGYDTRDLKIIKENIRNTDRESLFKMKSHKKKDYGVVFFNRVHQTE